MERLKAHLALVICAAFVSASAPWRARAQESSPAARVAVEPSPSPNQAREPAAAPAVAADTPVATAKAAPVGIGERQQVAAAPADVASAPVGGDKTGVSSQAIALPQGAGKIQGMGESFSTQLSTGVATYTVPFALVPARGAVQPALSLAYSSGAGHGIAGVGWDVGWPYVARQTDRGLPSYDDRAQWHPQQDRFVFGGGQELVPICTVQGTTCSGALAGEAMPAWAHRWQYFRARVEGSFLRFFWSPDHRTWRVQSNTGESLELGVPLDGSGYAAALEADPDNPSHVFRWNLVRQYDDEGPVPPAGAANPAPVNLIVYRYADVGGLAYVTDIYDTPPATNSSAPVSAYAHHTRLVYETRTDTTFSFRRGWRVDQTQRLVRVDVTSATFAVGGPRRAVRRYQLSYDPAYHVSLLASVQLEGRCAGAEADAPAEDPATESLPTQTGCATLPPVTLGYQHVTPFRSDGSPGSADLAGYEGFDERVVPMKGSPQSSIDDDLTDLFDINSDGLPDVVVTTPAKDAKFPLYLSGAGGARDTFRASTLGVRGVLGATASSLRLSNDNVAVSDIDGDGTIDWLHQPAVRSYAVYTPALLSDGWSMVGRAVPAAASQDPRLDLGEDTPDIQVFDANGDGLVDVVRATGTTMETFFSLGRYPGGDGSFGSARWTGPTTAELSLSFVPSCIPLVAPGVPVRFSDSTIRLGDMNGDGLTDIVYLYRGDIRYWPGRGDGSWGTGQLGACMAGFAQGTHVAMAQSPDFSDLTGANLRLDDVNGDGLDDLVQMRQDAVDIWLNVDGTGFTSQRHVIPGVQPAQGPLWASKMRLVDVNGSGTRDILWGEGGKYRYIDLQGGQRPWVLTHVANGLGKTTDIEYGSSTAMMLAAEAAGRPWQSKVPMAIHVVERVTQSDNLPIAGRPGGQYVTEYTYRDPVYDGRQREFRGFREALETIRGDANSPTSFKRSTFLLGECAAEGGVDHCAPSERWRDNVKEALKDLQVLVESYDESGTYASTAHTSYTLRGLYVGLDGREVRHAFPAATDTYTYDTSPFAAAAAQVSLPEETDEVPAGVAPAVVRSAMVTVRGARAAHVQQASVVDPFGNATQTIARGCVDGCPVVDETITTASIFGLPPGDGSGWLWRKTESYVVGSAHTSYPLPGGSGRMHHSLMDYDPSGHLVTTSNELAGVLALDRFHEDPSRAVAPPPPGAAQNGVFVASTRGYDGFGNLVIERQAGGRCRALAYDSDYAALDTVETIYTGANCSGLALTARAQYDRGLGEATTVADLHDETTVVAFDGLGRKVALRRPDPVTGAASALPSVQIEYILPPASGGNFAIVHTRSQNGAAVDSNQYRDTWGYVDGIGRAIVTLEAADRSAGDGGDWIANGLSQYDGKGALQRVFLAWFWDGDPAHFAPQTPPPTGSTLHRYDAFGREVQSFGLDGAITKQQAFHALSTDVWDAADLAPGPHYGTYASERKDGHGRSVSAVERIHAAGGLELHETQTQYLPSGEPELIARARGGDRVVRWLRYDTLGRMVLNVEPDTSTGFTPDPTADPTTLKAWRYAYDDVGQIVGTSDARGCGVNYYYDPAGRVVAEDYSPCRLEHALYSPPDFTVGAERGVEVLHRYDAVDPASSGAPIAIDPRWLAGRLVSTSDRAALTMIAYDGRGRTTGTARRVARPGTPDDSLPARYAPRWYAKTAVFDAADRETTSTTGATVDVLRAGGRSDVTTVYSARGAVARVTSSYGDLVVGVVRDADGPIRQVTYGDAAATVTAASFDARRRLASVQTYRAAPALWSAPPPNYTPAPLYGQQPPTSFPLLLVDTDYRYDEVDNPVEIRDWRIPSEWPSGAKPVTRKMRYDDLFRLARIDYQYTDGDASWVSPYASEDSGGTNPRRETPSPHVAFGKRVSWQTFAYDWLGNTVATDDDAHGFYDRSLGAVANGAGTSGPYRLGSATGRGGPLGGSLGATYDAAGNLATLAVSRAAGTGACLPAGSTCSQRFAYDWDEVGRLARARRWDVADPTAVPASPPSVELWYAYDADDERVLKSALVGAPDDPRSRHALYVFQSLEERGASWDGNDYGVNEQTEVPYLFAHGVRLARIAYETGTPELVNGIRHVLLELPDHVGSTSIVFDLETSELVEAASYQAYGQAESDDRPARWAAFREDYRFTGKEEDVEVGLQYFGKRYLSAALGRWVSPDPLTIHGLSADPNAYAYVHGRVLKHVDPDGLFEGVPPAEAEAETANNEAEQMSEVMQNAQRSGIGHFDENAVREMLKRPHLPLQYYKSPLELEAERQQWLQEHPLPPDPGLQRQMNSEWARDQVAQIPVEYKQASRRNRGHRLDVSVDTASLIDAFQGDPITLAAFAEVRRIGGHLWLTPQAGREFLSQGQVFTPGQALHQPRIPYAADMRSRRLTFLVVQDVHAMDPSIEDNLTYDLALGRLQRATQRPEDMDLRIIAATYVANMPLMTSDDRHARTARGVFDMHVIQVPSITRRERGPLN
jgi:RHS repeat-associated protein